MSDELLLNGKQYVSSKRAAEETGYARDYIGQLSRGGLIDAERVGGLWYVSMESLQGYEKNAETARSFTPTSSSSKEADSSLSFEGKEYISASRASKLTTYNQDYVGQLARAGKIPSRQIGNRWYVDREALVQHKTEKDALLAAVQSESVGIRSAPAASAAPTPKALEHILVLPQMTYMQESSDLMPSIPEKSEQHSYPMSNFSEIRPRSVAHQVEEQKPDTLVAIKPAYAPSRPVKRARKRISTAGVGVLTIILVLSVGFAGMKKTGTFARLQESGRIDAMSAGAAQAVGGIGDVIENWVSPPLVYHRGQ